MIVAPTAATALQESSRLDARYFTSPAVRLRSVIVDGPKARLRTIGSLANVWAPSRFKRTYAVEGEEFVSYLRPYDVFEFLPPEADRLSASRTGSLGTYRIGPGDLLQTCSGRNLGPLTIADEYLGRFALSHDMIRITIDDELERFYTLAFLQSETGQHLLRADLSGSVIDHITVEHVKAIQVPFIEAIRRDVCTRMRKATQLRESARIRLSKLIADYADSLPPLKPGSPLRSGWTHQASTLNGRLDAGFHDPGVAEIRGALQAKGGERVGDLAETFIPGRYTRYYVEPEHGKPIVSGRQLLQAWPINLRHIAARSFDFSQYVLEEGMIAFGAEGRAEERVAQPALITGERSEWLANNHVMRARPREGINAGWLYLAFAVPQVQTQVKACSCGSVVDAVNPADLNEVVLPPMDVERGEEVWQCWRDFSKASALETVAIARVNAATLDLINEAT